MHFLFKLLLLNFFLICELSSESIETFYGTIEVEEPVLIELIQSPAIQRLKFIHQYGVAYYTTHHEEYNRFDHSLGVFAILKMKGASLEEQIAGLLHDASHTVFSHVGDWVFGKEQQEDDYQSTIHKIHLAASGVEKILNRHGFTIDHVMPKRPEFVMLEQSLPDLSADRIDYNIQGAYYQNFLTKEETQELFQDLYFEEGKWITTRVDLVTELMQFSLFMTENCWGSALNYVTSRWLADAILRGLNIDLISWDDFHYGVDQEVWDKLSNSQDPIIQNNMHMLAYPADYYDDVDPDQANLLIKFRCRGIDPWIKHDGKIIRLTSIDRKLAEALQKTKEKSAKGWPIKIKSSEVAVLVR